MEKILKPATQVYVFDSDRIPFLFTKHHKQALICLTNERLIVVTKLPKFLIRLENYTLENLEKELEHPENFFLPLSSVAKTETGRWHRLPPLSYLKIWSNSNIYSFVESVPFKGLGKWEETIKSALEA